MQRWFIKFAIKDRRAFINYIYLLLLWYCSSSFQRFLNFFSLPVGVSRTAENKLSAHACESGSKSSGASGLPPRLSSSTLSCC